MSILLLFNFNGGVLFLILNKKMVSQKKIFSITYLLNCVLVLVILTPLNKIIGKIKTFCYSTSNLNIKIFTLLNQSNSHLYIHHTVINTHFYKNNLKFDILLFYTFHNLFSMNWCKVI